MRFVVHSSVRGRANVGRREKDGRRRKGVGRGGTAGGGGGGGGGEGNAGWMEGERHAGKRRRKAGSQTKERGERKERGTDRDEERPSGRGREGKERRKNVRVRKCWHMCTGGEPRGAEREGRRGGRARTRKNDSLPGEERGAGGGGLRRRRPREFFFLAQHGALFPSNHTLSLSLSRNPCNAHTSSSCSHHLFHRETEFSMHTYHVLPARWARGLLPAEHARTHAYTFYPSFSFPFFTPLYPTWSFPSAPRSSASKGRLN